MDAREFAAALDLLAPRGPDDSGVWVGEGAMLGHRRLAILDLSPAGHQPMELQPQGLVTVFNGELYNFIEVRRDLEQAGYSFRSESDTEVLLAAYAHWGADCLSRFNGMWACAIWDPRKRELFLARDRFGKKPLFYCEVGGRFLFASEMKALLPFLPEVKPSRHMLWMHANIHAYEATDECLVEGLRRLPAGHWAVYRDGRLSVQRYWDTLAALPAVPARYEDQVGQFRELFLDACRIRMRADVRLGTALSGGLDSSSVLAMVAEVARRGGGARVARDWQHAFTATFPGTVLDETVFAQRMAEHAGVRATVLPIDPAAALGRFEDDSYAFEEIYITNPVPMMRTYGAMRAQGVVVSLDGHGVDELLSGYNESLFTAYPDCRGLADVWDVIATYRGLFGESAQFVIGSQWHYFRQYCSGWVVRPRVMRAKGLLLRGLERVAGPGRMQGVLRSVRGPGPAPAPDPLSTPAAAVLARRSPRFGQLDHFGRHLYIMFHETSMPTLLRNYDRYSMANGIEIRMPFMDHRLVSFCFALPWHSKLGRGYTKRILRDAMGELLPDDIRLRKTKTGFGAPPVEWLRGPLRTYVQDTIRSRAFLECPVLADPARAAAALDEVLEAAQPLYRAAESAWTDLLTFLWYRGFLLGSQKRWQAALARRAGLGA